MADLSRFYDWRARLNQGPLQSSVNAMEQVRARNTSGPPTLGDIPPGGGWSVGGPGDPPGGSIIYPPGYQQPGAPAPGPIATSGGGWGGAQGPGPGGIPGPGGTYPAPGKPGGRAAAPSPTNLPGHGYGGTDNLPGQVYVGPKYDDRLRPGNEIMPPGVRPEQWAHPAWRAAWLRLHPEWQANNQARRPVAGPLTTRPFTNALHVAPSGNGNALFRG